MIQNDYPKIEIRTPKWIPTIYMLNDNANHNADTFLVRLRSPSHEIYEDYVIKSLGEMIHFIKQNFEEE